MPEFGTTDQYSKRATRYEGSKFWPDETFPDVFHDAVEEYPDRCVTGPNREITFEELETKANRLAASLRSMGVEPGDVVSYQLPNHVETWVVHAATAEIGAIGNPIVPIYRHSEVEYILDDAGASCVFTLGEHRGFDFVDMYRGVASELDELENVVVIGDSDEDGDSGGVADSDGTDPSREDPGTEFHDYASLLTAEEEYRRPAISPDDVHLLIYTSGTTSDPKGVLHTHNTVLAAQRNNVRVFEVDETTEIFLPSPVTHVSGAIWGLEMPFVLGSNVVVLSDWDADRAVELIDEHGSTFSLAATPFLKGIVEAAPDGWDCPLEMFGCGGADVPPDLVREATEQLDCKVFRAYGCSEHPAVTRPRLDTPTEKCAETDGPIAPGVDLKIRDPDTGRELPQGESGEVYVVGPQLMSGYTSEEQTEAAMENGWFKTGDVGRLDEHGYLKITGRRKDVINRGGENISVKEVENILHQHPRIEDVAVVAMPDPELQERACAYVSTEGDEGLAYDEMVDYLDEQNIAKQKYPERVEQIRGFPRTASGKIQKNTLRERIADELGMEPVRR